MKPTILAITTALALGLAAGCDRASEERTNTTTPAAPQSGSSAASGGTAAQQSNTPSTPANLGSARPGDGSPKEQPPVQGREDVRQPEQRRDFQHQGDGAGPKPQ